MPFWTCHSKTGRATMTLLCTVLASVLQGSSFCWSDCNCLHLSSLVLALQQAQALLSLACFLPGACSQNLQFRLHMCLHQLPIVTGCFSGGQHVPWVDRICSHCSPGTLVDDPQVVCECSLLQPLRLYADSFSREAYTMRSSFGLKHHWQVSSSILDCLIFLDCWAGLLTHAIRLVGWLKHVKSSSEEDGIY